jgi:hypothetical protein
LGFVERAILETPVDVAYHFGEDKEEETMSSLMNFRPTRIIFLCQHRQRLVAKA